MNKSEPIATFGTYGLHVIKNPEGAKKKFSTVGTVPDYLDSIPAFETHEEAVSYCIAKIKENGHASYLR